MQSWIDHDEGVRVSPRHDGGFDYEPLEQENRMTPAELRAAARTLGMTGNAMADALGISRRTWRRWLAGAPVPHTAALAVRAMLNDAAA